MRRGLSAHLEVQLRRCGKRRLLEPPHAADPVTGLDQPFTVLLARAIAAST
jgi:hypothetical protein